MIQGLIGSSGVIGKNILEHIPVDYKFNQENINEISKTKLDRLIIAAPSGNRRLINLDGVSDSNSIFEIVNAVSIAAPKRIVLISSVDSIVRPTTVYGKNRLLLEQLICDIAPTSVVRLSSLIGNNIQKNVLFDIKHNKFNKFINIDSVLQWCILDDIVNLIDSVQCGQQLNVVSEPIQNREIFDYFKIPFNDTSNTIEKMIYEITPYVYTKQQIFSAMERYLK